MPECRGALTLHVRSGPRHKSYCGPLYHQLHDYISMAPLAIAAKLLIGFEKDYRGVQILRTSSIATATMVRLELGTPPGRGGVNIYICISMYL